MPAAPTAPPPAKPSAPAPAQPTQPNGASDHEPSTESYLAEEASELSAMDASDAGIVSKPEETRERDDKGKFVKPPEKAHKLPEEKPKPEKPVEPQPEPEKPVEEPKPGTMRALGKAYDELKKERDTVLQPKLQSLEAKTKDYERQIEELRTKQPDLKPLQGEIEALKKERAQLLEVVRFSDYRKSPEFVDKYEKPYNEAWSKAVSEVTQLSMALEDGTSRKATANDLLALANAPLDQLDDLAAQWFPKSAPRVIRHVEKIRDLAEAQDKALEEAKKGAGEFHEKRTKEVQQANETFRSVYDGANKELTTKYPKWFAPDEADPQGNDILKKGFDYADTVFSPNGTQLTPEQRAGRLAVIRAKAANHDRLVARIKARDARVAELEAELAKFEQSEPPTEEAGQPGATGKVYDPFAEDEAELRRMDR